MSKTSYTTEVGSFRAVLDAEREHRVEIPYPPGAQQCEFRLYIYNGAVRFQILSLNRGIPLTYYRQLGWGNALDHPYKDLICPRGSGELRVILPRAWQDSGVEVVLTGHDLFKDGIEGVADCQFSIESGEVPSAIDQLSTLGVEPPHGER